jgi:hypothetical protein
MITSQLDANQIIQQLHVPWDYFVRSITTTTVANDTEVYTYKTGGASGTTVLTVTLVYTDATLTTVISGTRS